MSLPLDDPQFWIATLIALAAAGFLLRAALPRLGVGRRSVRRERRASLTVGGKPVEKK